MQTGIHYPLDIEAVPPHWKVGYVGDFVEEIQPGFASGKHNKEGAGVPHIRPFNIDRQGKLDLSEIKSVAPDADRKRLHSGDVLFNNTNSPELVGKTAPILSAGDWGFSNHMTRVRFNADVAPLFGAYQLHFLWMTGYYLHNCVKHVNQASVSSKALARTVPFIAPPLDEQKRIVGEIEKQFSRLDEAVANLNRVKANLKRYKAAVLKAAVEGRLVETEADLARRQRRSYQDGEALLTRILATRGERSSTARNHRPSVTPANHPRPLPDGWTWATVDQLAVLVEYGSSAKTNQDSSGIPVLRMGNILDGELLFDDLKYLPASHDEFPRLLLQDGDLLFNRTNSPELVGKTSVFRSSGAPCSFASYLIRVRLAEGIEPEFLAAYINSLHGRSWVKSVVTQQVGQANVNGTKLRGLTVPLPPTAEQRRIVAELERATYLLAETESRSRKNSELALGLRQSILSVVFNPNE